MARWSRALSEATANRKRCAVASRFPPCHRARSGAFGPVRRPDGPNGANVGTGKARVAWKAVLRGVLLHEVFLFLHWASPSDELVDCGLTWNQSQVSPKSVSVRHTVCGPSVCLASGSKSSSRREQPEPIGSTLCCLQLHWCHLQRSQCSTTQSCHEPMLCRCPFTRCWLELLRMFSVKKE